MNLGKKPPQIKMADFLLEWRYRSHRLFVRLLMINLRNEFCSSMCMHKAGKNNRGRYRACRSCLSPMTLNYQIFCQMWCIFQIWWVLGYDPASKTAVKMRRIILSLSITIGTSQVCDLFGPEMLSGFILASLSAVIMILCSTHTMWPD